MTIERIAAWIILILVVMLFAVVVYGAIGMVLEGRSKRDGTRR